MKPSELIKCARGDSPADLLITGGRVVNVFTGEILETEVAIAEGRIAGVGTGREALEVLDASGVFVVPGLTKPGSVCDTPVDYMNVYPTVADICGLPVGDHLEGVNMRALLADPDAAWDRPALTTHGRNNHALRSKRWRYIHYADGSEELYDHGKDPMEWTNLAADPRLAKVKRELAEWLPQVNVEEGPRKGKPQKKPSKSRRKRS